MKLSYLFTTVTLATVYARLSSDYSQFSHWKPPGQGDVRGPCPMLNTLANHGFLPHNGKDISEEHTIKALYSALNVNQSLSEFLFQHAVTTNPTPNATSFSLDNLDRHNILEHDASLSRGDFYFGDDHTFNQTIFDETKSYWTGPIIDVQMAANARLARVHTSNATNPTFTLTSLGKEFSLGETAAYILVLGDRVSATVAKTRVEYLFENERLPLELGWSRPAQRITGNDLDTMFQKIVNASDTSPEQKAMMIRNGGIHAGF